MKKLLCCAMALVLAMALFACGEKEDTKQSEISGLVKSYAADSIAIITDSDEVLTFALSDPDIQCENGVEVDKNVVLVYTGTIDGTNTEGATVVTIKDGDPVETAAYADDVKHIGGTVVEADKNHVSIKDHDGNDLSFDTSKAEIHYKNGIKAGNYVTIKYKGEINGTDTSGVTVISIYDFSANEQHETENNIKKITGTVGEGTSMNTLVLETSKGNMNFAITDAEKYIKNGLVVGNDVTVKYKGEIKGTDTSNVKVISVFDDAANEEAEANSGKKDDSTDSNSGSDNNSSNSGGSTNNSGSGTDSNSGDDPAPTPAPTKQTITGTVVDASMNTTTISTSDGELTFYTGDAEHYYKNGIQDGNSVTITYTGEIDGTNTEGVTVISVTDDDVNLEDDSTSSTSATTVTSNTYGGDANSDDATADSTDDSSDTEATADNSGDADADSDTDATTTVKGTVGDGTSKSALELVLADGTTQMFSLGDGVVDGSLSVGEDVTVTYSGDLQDVTAAVKVTVD